MNLRPENRSVECPSNEIASYIDGEFDAARELELEAHFSECRICSEELNQQKQFLCALNSSLGNEKELELPSDFAKLIVTNAESTVSGLRRPRERFNALFICTALFLFVLFALGAEAGNLFGGFSGVIDQVSAVGNFFGHLIYTIAIGTMIVLRSIGAQFLFGPASSILIFAAFLATLFVFSRVLVRFRRT